MDFDKAVSIYFGREIDGAYGAHRTPLAEHSVLIDDVWFLCDADGLIAKVGTLTRRDSSSIIDIRAVKLEKQL